jgi:glutamyl-tRNA synthetase
MEISHVVRADDLLASTARQILLMRLLGAVDDIPTYLHVPLVVGPDGERLAKRTRGAVVRDLRARGLTPEQVIGQLAHGLGLTPDPSPRSAKKVAASSLPPPSQWRKSVWRTPFG